MDQNEARARFAAARVARLATVGPRRRPHLVPVPFALGSGPDGDAVAFAVDSAMRPAGDSPVLENLEANQSVSVLVDHYNDDDGDDDGDDHWSGSWWVRADGEARVLEGGRTFQVALAGLSAKYHRYELAPPSGPIVVVDVKSWAWEQADGSTPG